MSFCTFSKESSNSGKTLIDNLFITNYLLDAPENAVKVYLYGLYLCQNLNAVDDVESFAVNLNLSSEEVIDYFKFWDDFGIVSIISTNPFAVKYYPLNEMGLKYRKFKPEKYADFTKAMQAVLSNRMISVSEFNEYFNLLESTAIKPEALIMIAKYCVDIKGDDIGVKYILATAKNFIADGITTPLLVEKKLSDYNLTTKEIYSLFNLMKINKKPEAEDQNLYKKWTVDYGYSLEILEFITKNQKVKNFKKLDGIVEELYSNKRFSEESISYHLKHKNELVEITISIAKQLGERIDIFEPYVNNYVAVWTSKGYDADALNYVANRNFKKRKRTFEQMNETINSLYRLGLVTLTSITEYITKNSENEKFISTLLTKMGEIRNPNEWDKENLATWRSWNFTNEMILEAGKRSAGKPNPIAYINSILSNWKSKNIYTVEDAERESQAYSNSLKNNSNNNTKLTTEQLVNKVNAKYLELKTQEEFRISKLNEKLAKAPEFKSVENEIGKTKFNLAKAEYDNNLALQLKLKTDLENLNVKKSKILDSIGINEENLKPKYVCKECQDTGYVNGVRCNCFYEYLEEFTAENLSK